MSEKFKNLFAISSKNWDEKNLEKKLISKLVVLGYFHFSGKEIKRSDTREVIILEDLKKYLSFKCVSDLDIEKIIQKLTEDLSSNTNDDFCFFRKYLCEGIELNKKIVYLIDFENLENNQFKVVNQLNILGPQQKKRIPDILIYVNGFPLVLFELKTPKNLKIKKIDEAILQITKDYGRNIPQLFKFVHFIVTTNKWHTLIFANGEARFRSSFQSSLITFVNRLFEKKRLLIYIRDYFYQINRDLKSVISLEQVEECERINKKLIRNISNKNNKIIQAKLYSNLSDSYIDVPMVFSKKITHEIALKDLTIVHLLNKELDTFTKSLKEITSQFEFFLEEKFGGLIEWNQKSFKNLQKGKVYIVDRETCSKNTEFINDNLLVIVAKDSMKLLLTQQKIKFKNFKKTLPSIHLLLFKKCSKNSISFKKIFIMSCKIIFYFPYQIMKISSFLFESIYKTFKIFLQYQ